MAYKTGDKFVIEIDSVMKRNGENLYGIKGFNSLVFDDHGLEQLERISGEGDCIKVGDEVRINCSGRRGIVLNITAYGKYTILDIVGSVDFYFEQDFTKTGRHFDGVEALLKKMRNETDD